MGRRWVLLFYVIITTYVYGTNGCTISGLPNWLLPENVIILDTYNGIIYSRSTSGIEGINSITHREEGLNGGPYVSVSFDNSELVISTNDNYKTFEEIETAESMGLTVNFRCTDGTSRILVFNIDITDTNNNDPVFKPSNSYEYTIAPPVPPNFMITNCVSDLLVRDIDLTTERIDFVLEGSSLFEIAYDNSYSVPKEFKAILRTTTFIRSIPEPITLTITATDVDRTGDPPRKATATVKIVADTEFAFPEEPIFSQPFYIANYTTEHKFILQDSIYLRQGYDSQVKFTLEGQFAERFGLITNGNEVTFSVLTELDIEAPQQKEIYLIVKAEREFTSGADAMIVLQLPEARELNFEKTSYSGYLEEDIVTLEDIILSEGYSPDIMFNLIGQYADFFIVKKNQSGVTVEIKEQIPENIVKENTFLVLDLSASGANAITASTTIFLEIIKLDYVTPVFSQNIYNGIYLTDSNVNFQSISLFQGYDETVTFDLVGDHANFISMETTPNNIMLALNSSIPEEIIFNEKVLLFNIVAEKPRTVGANTVVALKFPKELTEPTILKFTKTTYNGILDDGKLIVEDVILESGYTSQIKFTLKEDFNQNFIISNTNNVVTIALSSTVSMEELEKNKFVVLEIEATRERAIPVTTSVIIDIPEIDIVFPVFAQPFYKGSYTKDRGLEFTEEMTLQNGYDSSVIFSLEGASSQWFSLIQKENLVTLILNETNPLPEDIFDINNDLLFTVVANKPETIGGRATIHIDLLREIIDPIFLQFEKNSYIGRIENGSLQLERIRLLDVSTSSVELNLTGDYVSYFRLIEESDEIIIQLLDIPEEIIKNNNFIILNLQASQTNAIEGLTTIIFDIVQSQEAQIISPIFEQAYYTGEYSDQEGLIFFNIIKLIQGFDETVSFELDGDDSQWFSLIEKEENSLTLSLKNESLHEVTNKNLLIFTVVAHKTYNESTRSAVVISVKAAETLDFSKDYYSGYIEDNTIVLEAITLQQDYTSDINFSLHGDYVNYFQFIINNGVIIIQVKNEIPIEIKQSYNFLVFTLEANKQNNRAQTVIILELKKDNILLNFEKAFYIGSYSETHGLVFETEMRLVGEFDETVLFTLEGENSIWFSINGTSNSITLVQSKPIETSVINNIHNFVFTIYADKENISTRASIIIEILPERSGNIVLSFEQTSYIGSINNSAVMLNQITLNDGYSEDVSFTLHGEFASYFSLIQDEETMTLGINGTLPEEILAANRIIVLELKASAPNATSVTSVIVLEVKANETPASETLIFDRTYYTGHYTAGGTLNFGQTITLATGYDDTTKFTLEGAYTEWFQLQQTDNSATLVLLNSIPATILAANQVIVHEVRAEASSGATGRTIIVISHDYVSETEVTFDKVLYNGKFENGVTSHETITISGYSGTNIQIIGAYASSFEISFSNDVVTVRTASSAVIPADLTHIALTLQAGRTNAVLLLEVIDAESEVFDKILYNGKLENGVTSHETITLSGYSGTNVQIIGAYASSFEVNFSNNVVTVRTASYAVIPADLTHIVLTLQAGRASAVLLIDVTDAGSETEEAFDKVLYNGNIENGVTSHEIITISGYSGSNVQIIGTYASSFEVNFANNVVTVLTAPSAVIPADLKHIALTLQAGRASAVLLLDVTDTVSETEEAFDKVLYTGKFENGVTSHETITISGYGGDNVQITGTYASSFEVNLSNNVVTVRTASSAVIPADLKHIALTLQAGRASAVLLIDVTDAGSETEEAFDKVLYNGKIENGVTSHEIITISGYSGSNVQIIGTYAASFEVNFANNVVTVLTAPSAVIPADLKHIALTLQAGHANAVLLLDVTDAVSETEEAFDKVLYNGKLENGVTSHETITISGYGGNNVQIIGTYASSFEINFANNVVTVHTASSAVIPADLTHIALMLQAGRANAVLLLDVTGAASETEEAFDKVLYNGKVENGVTSHETITVSGYGGNNVQITGTYASSFEVNLSNNVVTVRTASSAVIPADLKHIALTLQAGRASAVLLLDVTGAGSETEEAFDKVLYNGKIENGVTSHEIITLSGYSGSNVQIIGTYASSFEVNLSNYVVTVLTASSAVIPADLTHITLTLQAGRASAVLLLDVTDADSETEVTFDKVLYNGKLENGVTSHETITISGYSGTNLQIIGTYAASFEVSFSNNVVMVRTAPSAVIPADLTHIALTLQAGRASAVLLLDVTDTGDTDPPAVTFSKSSYFLWVDVNQTGVVGRVEATAKNNEAILYSLQVDNDNLLGRISINNEGEIILSAFVQSGVHSFIATATAQNSQVKATASVLLRVESLPECGSDVGLPPLIVLEILEEEPHRNLVVFDQTKYENCRYNLINSWPADQSWLYIDDEGLHTRAIDREHESIAFMTLSQIQVELMLYCDSDEVSVAKRSLNTERLEPGSDKYGSNKWILADTIVYDPRRSFVNLIVNDINDNSPIFMAKENEPISVGYPLPELEDMILPRALIELKAKDADIGENAALIYWSTEDNLAVAPQTGFVHVRNNARLENNSRLTVYATDLNGRGLNGTLDIVVKLLDKNQIAVMTVQNAFLDDENTVLSNLSHAIGYEIKVLRTVVISENNDDSTRKRRDIASTSGASLQLYVYGLYESEPVDVVQLTSDINNSNVVTVNIARVLSLEDHLEGLEICPIPGRDIGLLVTTIVLAVLLLLVIIAIALWFILIRKCRLNLKWKEKQNYDQFDDDNSLASRNNTLDPIPKVETPPKPRLNIEELKRSERRLQEMLDIPIKTIEPENKVEIVNNEPLIDTIVDISDPVPQLPIVIQSIDKLKDNNDDSGDEDEFGEKKAKRRKSVVTFNENVEKIIHLEDNLEYSPEPNLEIYKF